LAAKGHPVEKMKRVKIGNLELGGLPPGKFRELTGAEVTGLEKMLDKTEAAKEFRLKNRGGVGGGSAQEKFRGNGGWEMAKKSTGGGKRGGAKRGMKITAGERLVGGRVRESRKSAEHTERDAARMKRDVK
jgi:hypothetical protein